MHIDKLKYFIDLVNCKNFTETAKLNFVSQTTISQQIASLESTYNMKLIDRDKKPIEPTPAGWLFYNEAIILWKQYKHLSEKMIDFQANHSQLLSVAYATLTDIQSLLPFIPSFKQAHPTIKLDFQKISLKDISTYLHKGIYDIAIAVDSEFKATEEIDTFTLYQGKYSAAVSKHHPLFNHQTITKEALYQHPLVMLDSNEIGNSYQLMIEHALKDGYQPKIKQAVTDVESELVQIVTENLIGFFPDNYQLNYSEEEIRLIPLEDSYHTFTIEMGYVKHNSNPALQTFLHNIHDWFSQ
ncbi:hca operon transcriptional activator HcaR [Paraliobacillus ryukyuensis]|uniref:DNA-binding transcriptional LysR family regulator n=1 Tax=Paraliobacillus ryukyuensis TaxID=200904 RepID=A0A366E3Y7_9BACI|nr:LysR family transcriptional regulator [Paraliobacillus ryukyuensis]RBO97086.1 DNA-binding transcriptional LysR family regulator [Paraliobacillus ryukyuensis]